MWVVSGNGTERTGLTHPCLHCSRNLRQNEIDLAIGSEVPRAHVAMMAHRMVLGEVVGLVVGSFVPENFEHALFDTVLQPVVAHVDSLGSTLLDCFVADASGRGVVCHHVDWWLWVAHLRQGGDDEAGFFAVFIEGAQVGFGGGSDDIFHDVAVGEDSAIVGRTGV